jgi:predicted nucleic acid-binding protein
MASNLTVLYDACVLYPNYLRDLLIELATTELFQAKWTEQIHDEWIRNLLKNRPNATIAQFQKLRELINASVPDCLVTNFEDLIPSLQLPDLDDRHVFAAAIVAKADVMVTVNLRDFPAEVLAPHGLIAQHPDEFIADLIDLRPLRVIGSIETIRNRFKNPPFSFDEYMEILLRQGLPTTVSMLRQLQSQRLGN